MMHRPALFAAVLLTATGIAFADGTQTGVIAGRVVDLEQQTIAGVEVVARGDQASRQAVTDDAGRFRFPAVAAGRWLVSAELLGLRAAPRETAVYVGRSTDVKNVETSSPPINTNAIE